LTAARRGAASPADGAAPIVVGAPAKINLWLHLVGRRPDGYHLLDSLVAFAAIGDSLAIAPAPELSLTVDGPFAAEVPKGADNLVLRAARDLAHWADVAPGARLALTKRLPVAAGIGGGSANAAAALRGLARLWRLEVTADRLAALALALGADVPVCLAGRPAHVGGIGERVTPVAALPAAPLLLVNPRIPLATEAVFRAWAATPGAAFGAAAPPWPFPPGARPPRDAAALAAALAATRNDLAAAACGLAPTVGEAAAVIAAQPDCLLARMSGSGGTCFGIFATATAARAAEAAIAVARPGWWVAATTLAQDPIRSRRPRRPLRDGRRLD